MTAPDPSTNRVARRATRSGGSSERRAPAPHRVDLPALRQWAMRRH